MNDTTVQSKCCEKCTSINDRGVLRRTLDCLDKSCPCHTPTVDSEGWVEGYYERYVKNGTLNKEYYASVNSFIRQTIASVRAEEREQMEHLKKLLAVAKCPDPDCDNNGTIAVRISDDEWEPQQCQWCDEKRRASEAITAIKG